MLRARTIAALMLAVAVVLQAMAVGVARAHDAARAYGVASGCRHDASLHEPGPATPRGGSGHDCFLCQQCVGDASFDEILPFVGQGPVHPICTKGEARVRLNTAGVGPVSGRAQLPRAPPRRA